MAHPLDNIVTRKIHPAAVIHFINELCDHLELPRVIFKTMHATDKAKGIAGTYNGHYRDKSKCVITLHDWRDLRVGLHELAHHVQEIKFEEECNTPHDASFTKAIRLVRKSFVELYGAKSFRPAAQWLR